MAKTTQIFRPRFPLALVALSFLGSALLTVAFIPPGTAKALKDEGRCAQAKPSPTPSYESFGRQSPVAAESPEWRIDLKGSAAGPECLTAFLFRARSKQNDAVSQFRICNETTRVDEVDVVNESRALVLGRVTSSAPVANVVDLPSGKVEDHFGCVRPALSPSHRFLAFVKDFPSHPGPVAINFEYIVYDLTRSAEYNRPHFKPGVRYDAGWPVYPPGATNAQMENVLPEGSEVNSPTSPRLFWLEDERLAFGDFFQGHNRLVVANLSRGVKDVDVRTLDLNPSELVDLDQCKKAAAPSDFEEWSKEPAAMIHVTQIEPVADQPGMACLYFDPFWAQCLRYRSLMVKLP